MRVVCGAGIVGVCTAYFLRRAGFEVTVLERRSGVAQEGSFANAGVMAPGYVGPWASPGMPRKVLSYLFRPEAPVVFRPSFDLALWRWLRRWLGECELERYRRNRARMQRLAFYSQAELRALRAQYAMDYEQATGYLQLFRTEAEIEATAASRTLLGELGVRHVLLDAGQCRALEPALHRRRRWLADCTCPMTRPAMCLLRSPAEGHRHCGWSGVPLRHRSLGFDASSNQIRALNTSAGPVSGDAFVVAGGIDSRPLLERLGVRLPMIAVKGYSATAAITAFSTRRSSA